MIQSKEDELWEGQYEEDQEKRDKWNAYIAELKGQIHEYADNDEECGWLIVKHESGKYFNLPKRALIHYVFGNTPALAKLLPEYEAFSPSGMKLQMDNRFHTDVLIGAGFDIDDIYFSSKDTVQDEVLWDARDTIEKEMRHITQFDFTILANGMPDRERIRCQVWDCTPKDFRGSTNYHIEDIDPPKNKYDRVRAICVPKASVEYELVAKNAEVIITETGGKLAHLAILSRESGKILIRVDNACEKFPHFTKLQIDFKELTLEADYH